MDSQSGPSQEELKSYFRNNRQYFDELAKSYYQSDREYYNKFIAPFYNNPFIASASKSGRKPVSFILMSIMIFFVGLGAVMFFLVKKNNSPVYKTPDKNVYQKNTGNDTNESNYFKGLQFMSEQDYDNAEEYLKRVSPKDKNYKSAQ